MTEKDERRVAEEKNIYNAQKAEEDRARQANIKAEKARHDDASRIAEERRFLEEALKQQEDEKATQPPPKAIKIPVKSDNITSTVDMTTAELMESLGKLEALREQGVLSAEEYESQHNDLLKYYLGIKR